MKEMSMENDLLKNSMEYMEKENINNNRKV